MFELAGLKLPWLAIPTNCSHPMRKSERIYK